MTLRRIPRPLIAIAAGSIALVCATLVCAALAACAPGSQQFNRLGVLPPQPPRPLWMGAVRPEADPTMRGAAAITTTPIPDYSHVLVSISGGTPGRSYAWTLHSGSCGSPGTAIPVNGPPLVTYPDGTAKADGYVPQKLTPNTPYSVVIGSGDAATPPACADLSYGSM